MDDKKPKQKRTNRPDRYKSKKISWRDLKPGMKVTFFANSQDPDSQLTFKSVDRIEVTRVIMKWPDGNYYYREHHNDTKNANYYRVEE